ncbi:hypothetical protein D3C78_1597670 [compost metagenome]
MAQRPGGISKRSSSLPNSASGATGMPASERSWLSGTCSGSSKYTPKPMASGVAIPRLTASMKARVNVDPISW